MACCCFWYVCEDDPPGTWPRPCKGGLPKVPPPKPILPPGASGVGQFLGSQRNGSPSVGDYPGFGEEYVRQAAAPLAVTVPSGRRMTA